MSKKPHQAGLRASVEATAGSDDAAPAESTAVALDPFPDAPIAADPAPPTSAIGLPLDEHHGKGGTYVIRNGVRTLRNP